MTGEVSISLFWLLNNYPEVLDAWNEYMKPKREAAKKEMQKRIDAVQKWLDADTEINDDSREVIQFSIDMFNQAEDNEQRRNSWNIMLAFVRHLPSFPYRRGFRGVEEE